MTYLGKYNKSRKAVDLKLIEWVYIYIINKNSTYLLWSFFSLK